MRRRAFISLAVVTLLAGCTSLLGDDGVDTTIADDELVEFQVDDGAELTITVEVEELAEPEGEDGEDIDVERNELTFQLNHVDNGVVDAWTIEDSDTFEVTIDEGGPHNAMIIGGSAHVTIE